MAPPPGDSRDPRQRRTTMEGPPVLKGNLHPRRGQPRGPAAGQQDANTRVVAPDNRRRASRADYHADVDLESSHNFYTGFTENISTGGIFVSTYDLIPIGSKVTVSFSIPNLAHPITVRCVVKWHRVEEVGNPENYPGMGLQFTQLDANTAAAIAEFARTRETLFYVD